MNALEGDRLIENKIIHRWRGGESLRSIAKSLCVSRWRVSRTVTKHQKSRVADSDPPINAQLPPPKLDRGSKLDAFETQITQLLTRYPNMTATRVMEELRDQGYDGGYTILRQRIKQLRKTPTKPLTVRFETSAGAQAQMDWAVYDLDFTSEGRRRVNLFSYILGYSRRQYLHFTERQDFETTVREHIKAFEHLQGLAATCLYDNMKVVVTRWEDEQPIYNTRFLAFATHYGFRPWACRPRRPETKGKVERPFYYVETSLLNGRTFRSLEHLNDVTRWWLANRADVRKHRTTKKRPIDAHAEEQPHLLPLPAHHYDTARVVYRVVSSDGTIVYGNNDYSVPWQLIGKLLPVRVTEDDLLAYDPYLKQVACHPLIRDRTGAQQIDRAHRPPENHTAQVEELRVRFAQLGDIASRFLEGLLAKHRSGKHQAKRVLALLTGYRTADLLAAMERAVRYHAYSYTSLERILAIGATPKPGWQELTDSEQETLRRLTDHDSITPRPSTDYQYLLSFDEDEPNADETDQRERDSSENSDAPDDTQDPDDGRATG